MKKNEPEWIIEETVLKIHDAQIAEHGGTTGIRGIRDRGLLQSALSQPLNLFSYTEANIFELAAAYAERIVKNHPFVDGNKRTAYVVMVLFLSLNGFKLTASKEDKVIRFVQLASGKISLNDFVVWLETNISSI